MTEFKTRDRVRLWQGATVGVQPGVEPGTEGTVLDDRPNFAEFRGVKPTGRYYIVLFNGRDRPDIVDESALEPV